MADNKNTKKAVAKKTAAPKEAEISQPTDRVEMRASDWNLGTIFWGMLLIVVGGLVLLSNFGIVKLEWANVWRIWPIAIIAAGVSILSVRSAVWKFVSAILMALTLVVVVLLATGAFGQSTAVYETYISNIQQASGVDRAEVTVNGGASKVRVTSGNLDVPAKATLRSNVSELKEESSVSGNTQYVSFSSESSRGMWFVGNFQNDWDVTINEDKQTRLVIDAGASDIDVDVSKSKVDDVTLKAGASSSRLTLGDRADLIKVNVDSGASSVTIRVPKASGVSLKIDGGLVSKHLADLREITENYYQSDNYDKASKRIEIVADIGAANITIERY